jgi:hypothetical protein
LPSSSPLWPRPALQVRRWRRAGAPQGPCHGVCGRRGIRRSKVEDESGRVLCGRTGEETQ